MYYFCSDTRYCTCDFRWTWLGYMKFAVSAFSHLTARPQLLMTRCLLWENTEQPKFGLLPWMAARHIRNAAGPVEFHSFSGSGSAEACGRLFAGWTSARWATLTNLCRHIFRCSGKARSNRPDVLTPLQARNWSPRSRLSPSAGVSYPTGAPFASTPAAALGPPTSLCCGRGRPHVVLPRSSLAGDTLQLPPIIDCLRRHAESSTDAASHPRWHALTM